MPRVDNDRLANASATGVARAGMELLNANQMRPRHERVLAAAVYWLILLEVYKLDAQEIMTKAENLMNRDRAHRAEFLALKLFAENER